MDALLAAGGIPQPGEPLYSYARGEAKALIDIAGKPMIQWVLDALGDAKTIQRVVVIGLTKRSGLTCKKPLIYLSNQGRLLDNVRAGTAKVLELNPKAKYVLFVSSDLPGITGNMVDWVVKTCMETQHDLYYNVIRRESMEERFPLSKRTYTRLKDMEVCGGDMNVLRTRIVGQDWEFWNKVFEARKNPRAQAALLGPDIMFRLALRQLTIDDIVQRVAAKVGLRGRAIVCPYPEIGMDVDKPHQLEILRTELARRVAQSQKAAGHPAGVQRGPTKRAPARKTAVRRAAGGRPRATTKHATRVRARSR